MAESSPDVLTTPRTFQCVADGNYRLDLPVLGLTFHAGHCRRQWGALVADVSVRSTQGGRSIDGLLAAESMDLSKRADRSRLAAFLAVRGGRRLDWVGAVELLCVSVMEADRRGSPILRLSEAPLPDGDRVYDVLGVPILQAHPTILFGKGGDGKSLLALYIAGTLAQRGVSTLYADWEFDPSEHRLRLTQMFGQGHEPGLLHYVRCQGPLTAEAPRLAEWMATHHCRYLVCDSIAFGVEGPPDKAEAASAYYRALRSLNVGSLLLAHTTKGSGDAQKESEERPFGSVFWTNGARSVWYLKRAESSEPRSMTVGLYHRKTNTGPLLPARGIRLAFSDEAVRLSAVPLTESAELEAKLPLWQRMRTELDKGPMVVSALAELLDVTPAVVIRTAKSHTGIFDKVGDLVRGL